MNNELRAILPLPPHLYLIVNSVTLHRCAACLLDEIYNVLFGHTSVCGTACGFGDALLDHGAVEVVNAKVERHLCYLFAEHDPVSLDVVEVVEKHSRNRERLEVVKTRGVC